MAGKIDSKGSNINTDLIQYVPKTLFKKEVRNKPKHVDLAVKSIKPFTLADTKALSDPHKNTSSLVNCCKTTSSTSSCADQNLIFDKISHLYDYTEFHPIYSVVFKGSKPNIGINFSTDNLKARYNQKNGAPLHFHLVILIQMILQ